MLDFQHLEQKGMMSRYSTRLPLREPDDSLRYHAVTVKDFSPLYALAYEYHCWIECPEYIPPEREYVDLIMENPELAAWLCRFDNYRRILICRKPGRKPKGTQPLTVSQVLQLHALAQQSTNVLNMNSNLNSNNHDDSTYRRDQSNQALSSREVSGNSTSSEGDRPSTIGNRTAQPEIESSGNREGTKNNEKQPVSKSNSSPHPTEGTDGAGAAAKEVKEKRMPQNKQEMAAMAGIPAEHWMKLMGQKESRPPAYTPKRMRRPIPPHLETNTRDLAAELHDNPAYVRSDITRMAKLYFASKQIFGNFSVEWFYQQMSQAKDQAGDKANIEYATNGDPNRVPYFFTCFETQLGFNGEELAYIRSNEPLYEDGYIGDFVQWYRQQKK